MSILRLTSVGAVVPTEIPAAAQVSADHPETAASVTIGDLTLHDLPGIYVPSGGLDGVFPFAVAGRISHEFFRHTAVTLDFATMTLVLAPA